jgi:hypothetical protein
MHRPCSRGLQRTVTPSCHDVNMSSTGVGWGTCEGDDGTVLDAIVKLLVADPAQCERDGLDLLARRSLRVRSWLDSVDAGIAAQASKLAAEGSSSDAATVLSNGGRRSRRDAEAAAARGDACQRMPVLGDALARGEITAGHVDAVVAAARSLDDDGKARLADHADTLVAAAKRLSPEQFHTEAGDLARNLAGDDGLSRHERMRRDRNVRRWVDRQTGMHKTLLSLDPLADAKVWTAINAATATARAADQSDDERTWDQLQADVVVDLLTGARADGERAVPEVSVLIDYDTLLDGLHDASVCETSEGAVLPVDALRRLCCEADVVPIVFGGMGEPLDVGRQCRTATRAQRRALRAMYRTCAHPQCTVAFDACRIHHVVFWFHGGVTDLDNLLPLCELHHHLVHEGGWTLTLGPDRRTVWRTPDGSVCFDGITIDRRLHVAAATGTDADPTPAAPCRRPRRALATAAEISAELLDALDALDHLRVGAGHGDDSGRGPP